MRTAGEASWRLSVSDGGALDEALWLRDALSLDLSLDRSVDDAADDVPPEDDGLRDVPPLQRAAALLYPEAGERYPCPAHVVRC